ncbi:hypothetical protein CVT26_009543 [Gymnopilus dilepis]|uniref:Arrestin-like N-terminal domain-containing protein n=1 Tax=Gymnopilus dilepis TaxID=231916 RepID=A0A409VKE4_9AGAR|nr:hypothetical protein CVT26_009543 [Gymnopilus dilepis]
MDASYPPRYSTLAGALPNDATLGDITAAINNSEAMQNTSTPLNPPSYSSVYRNASRRRQPMSPRQDQNVASGSSGPQVHEYHIKTGSKSNPWATLQVFSKCSADSGSSGQKVPCFTSSDSVQGALQLTLDSPQNINSISLSRVNRHRYQLRGRIITSSYEDGSSTFLDHPVISWSRSNGDPRCVSPSIEDNVSSRAKKFDGKLSGQYSWPFCFPFPKSLPAQGHEGGLPVPQSFFERGVQASVQYDLVLRMTHGLLRSDSKMQVNIAYVPDIAPGPSSILRNYAYSERSPLPGPEIDPEGWLALPTTVIRGRLFSDRMIKLRSSQSFTRGTIIPCHLSVECTDEQALDLLANPKSLAVRLLRRVEYCDDGTKNSISSSRGVGNADVNKLQTHTSEVERAVWLPTRSTNSSPVRQFNGEIHLNKELQPSCLSPLFKVSYYVELLPFECSVFKPSSSTFDDSSIPFRKEGASRALLSRQVTIATLHGEGPRPVPFTKPKHRKERKTTSRDFSSSIVPVALFQCM